MFKHVKPPSRTFEGVISQIQDAVLGGKLKVGDKLPGERKLQEMFNVSRGTLREALRALEQKKIIRIKTGVGGGAIVCDVGTAQVSESLDLLLQYQKITVEELAEFREDLEGMVAAKAAQKVRKQDLAKLKGLLKSMKDCLPFGVERWNEFFQIDKMFHLSLVQIIGNRLYESILNTLYANISQYFARYLFATDARVLTNSYRELLELTEAIEKKDPKSAKSALEKHVRRYHSMMKEAENREQERGMMASR